MKTRFDWWWVTLEKNRGQTEQQTGLLTEAGCVWLFESVCSETGFPHRCSSSVMRQKERERRRMCWWPEEENRKDRVLVLFAFIWHVAALTDSRPGDRAGWLVLCRSGSGHGSAVSALTEIPTPWSLAHILIACNSQTHSRSPQH